MVYDFEMFFVCYVDGIVNWWNKFECLGVVIENGYVVVLSFVVVDIFKEV